MAYYACENKICGFLFHRSGPVDACPDCGSAAIRPATETEIAEFVANHKTAKNKNAPTEPAS